MNEQTRIFGTVITRLINKDNLSKEEAFKYFSQVLGNEETEMQQGAFLAALTAKGETIEEIAGSWQAIYDLDTIKVKPDTSDEIVDNCGTGMDAFKTFNISTSASIIAAAGGVTMAKHGARAITSACGTIDILEELGIDVECEPRVVKQSIEKAGIGIFNGMSPLVHPQALGRILSNISFGTILNISASLANPALPRYAVRGVYSKELLEPVALVMREIGYKKALVVHGMSTDGISGMDEASTIGETFVAELTESGEIVQYSFNPEDLGIKRAQPEALVPGKDRKIEALRMIDLLRGQENSQRTDIVCLNAGLIFYLMSKSTTIEKGFQKAKEIIDSGLALEKLKEWVREQNVDPAKGYEKLQGLLEATLTR